MIQHSENTVLKLKRSFQMMDLFMNLSETMILVDELV